MEDRVIKDERLSNDLWGHTSQSSDSSNEGWTTWYETQTSHFDARKNKKKILIDVLKLCDFLESHLYHNFFTASLLLRACYEYLLSD